MISRLSLMILLSSCLVAPAWGQRGHTDPSMDLTSATAPSGHDATSYTAPRTEQDVRRRVAARTHTMSAREALEWLTQLSRINVTANWDVLELDGIDPDTSVTMVSGVTLVQAVELVIRQIETRDAPLVWESSPYFMTILSKPQANRRPEIRIYDISDIMHEVRDFSDKAHSFDLSELASQDTSGGGSGGLDLFGDSDDDDAASSGANRGQRLIDIIQNTIEPDIWGIEGSIRIFNGQMIVRAPQYVHRQIGRSQSRVGRDGSHAARASTGARGARAVTERQTTGGLIDRARGGSAAFDPQVSVIHGGTRVVSRATVGADPRYVNWGGTASQVNVRSINQFSVGTYRPAGWVQEQPIHPRRRSNGVSGIDPAGTSR